MTTESNNAQLFAKIAQVMARVRTLERTGENKFDHYSYVTADAIANRLGSVMAEVGLAFLPSMIGVETSEYTTQKGGTNFRTVVTMQMTYACTETGAIWTSLWQGEAIDRSDKSISKAAVSCVKYALLKTFLLSGGDEDEADAESPAVEAARNVQTPATRTQGRATGKPAAAPRNTAQRPVTQATDGADVDGDVPFDRDPYDRGENATSNPFDDTPNPRGWFHAEIAATFPKADTDAARHWFIRKYTSKATPDNVRSSTNDLSDDELLHLVDTLKQHRQASQAAWFKYCSQNATPEPQVNGVA